MSLDKIKFIKGNIWSIVNTFLLIGLLVFYLKNKSESKKTYYINNTRVFNEFNMTKDMLKVNQGKVDKKKNKLDSLISEIRTFEINNNSTDKDKNLLSKMQNNAMIQNGELNELQESITNEIAASVWNRLNEYVKVFGEEYDFELILGTQGRGNVMYAKDDIDLTNQFLEYANEKYEGN